MQGCFSCMILLPRPGTPIYFLIVMVENGVSNKQNRDGLIDDMKITEKKNLLAGFTSQSCVYLHYA